MSIDPHTLYDKHGRVINYLRLAVTDRCNLRCQYCMPEEGITYMPRQELMTYEEMERVIRVLAQFGVNKLRITGGEPFLRKGLMSALDRFHQIDGITSIHITTNGTLIRDLIPEFTSVGIQSVNLSLDSLDPKRFFEITRRNDLDKVMESLQLLVDHEITTKINMVVMNGKNIEDIHEMLELTKHLPISVRFLEEMPFNGSESDALADLWDHRQILQYIMERHPKTERIVDGPSSTSMNYQIPGYVGSFGIIASYTRTFCGTCNRLRLTPQGLLKTCLYDSGIFNIKDLMRAGASDAELASALRNAVAHKAKNGHEAERDRADRLISESMATIGG